MYCFRDKYIMSQDMFKILSTVDGFNQKNGYTYQQHILITSWYRIPNNLPSSIINAKTGNAALKILINNKIFYDHDHKNTY